MKILWLASWYPTCNNPLAGDFIKRHAEAVSLISPLHVIHVERVQRKKKLKGIQEAKDLLFPGLTSVIKYYSVMNFFGLEKIYSYIWSLMQYHSLVKKYFKEHGKPDIIHVHIALRCGLVGLYFKIFYKIPYVVTEQYSGYMNEARGHLRGIDSLNKLSLGLIFKNAAVVTPVSKALGDVLNNNFKIKKIQVIPNVVNTSIFFYKNLIPKSDRPVFLHVSTLTYQKNPEQMLEAFSILKRIHCCSFILNVVGPKRKDLEDLVVKLQINENVFWFDETSQAEIASFMQHADALVLYSRFETFGCVNIEAMATGLPTIVSDIPVFREYLTEGVTSFFAQTEDPQKLAIVLNNFIHSEKLSPQKIAGHARLFNYETIGKQIMEIYSHEGEQLIK